MRHCLLALLVVPLMVSTAWGVPTIVVGNTDILPGPNQVVTIDVTGGDAVAGFKARVQIQDNASGPLIANPADPNFGVDLETGTIFALNNTGQVNSTVLPRIWVLDIITNVATVNATGVMMTVYLDASGLGVGTVWDLKLAATLAGSSVFLDEQGSDITTSITDGTVTIVPEPASIILFGAPCLGMLIRRRLRRR
jgi:hypothetical protein